MSRIAKMPVSIPSGVEVVIKDGQVSVKLKDLAVFCRWPTMLWLIL